MWCGSARKLFWSMGECSLVLRKMTVFERTGGDSILGTFDRRSLWHLNWNKVRRKVHPSLISIPSYETCKVRDFVKFLFTYHVILFAWVNEKVTQVPWLLQRLGNMISWKGKCVFRMPAYQWYTPKKTKLYRVATDK